MLYFIIIIIIIINTNLVRRLACLISSVIIRIESQLNGN